MSLRFEIFFSWMRIKAFSNTASMESVSVTIEIDHSFQGDLQVTLISPDGREAILHDRTGSAGDGLKKTYAPTEMIGAQIAGTWQLAINDNANSFGLVFSNGGAGKIGRQ